MNRFDCKANLTFWAFFACGLYQGRKGFTEITQILPGKLLPGPDIICLVYSYKTPLIPAEV